MDRRDEELQGLRRRVALLERALGQKTIEIDLGKLGGARACPEIVAKLACDPAIEAIEFYKEAFGAEEVFRVDDGKGKIAHAVLQFGDSLLFISDAYPELGHDAGSTAINLFVRDADSVIERVSGAKGAKALRGTEENFWGDRSGLVVDQFGQRWNVSTLLEEIPTHEIERRAAREFG